MKEIGGYMELEHFSGEMYYPEAVALNSARNALLYLVKAKKISKVYLPYYLCDCVYEMCKRFNIDYQFYHIGENFEPIFNKTLADDEYLYIVNYFGQISNNKIKEFKDAYNNIIVDNVQAFFQKPVKNIDTIYSCRKFFGVSDGGFLSTDTFMKGELPVDKSKGRLGHLLGRYEESASEYYGDFSAGEEKFYDFPLCEMSMITRNILSAVDYGFVKKKREENYSFLDSRLKNLNGLNFNMSVGPYCYPLLLSDVSGTRKKLAEEKIYVPTLWPNVLNDPDASSFEKAMAADILPIPCDQRYNVSDMDRIIEEVLQYV